MELKGNEGLGVGITLFQLQLPNLEMGRHAETNLTV